jgi:putative mRNA 3-end processing factor
MKQHHGRHGGVDTIPFGEERLVNGVKFSFHPAGHIIGSAQIRAEYKGEVWVVSGDYKTEQDGISEPFEPVRCHTFVTESTFGLPIYNWEDQASIFSEINEWWRSNAEQDITSIISAYALGKAQRIIHNVDHGIGPIYCHAAVENINKVLRRSGVYIQDTRILGENVKQKDMHGALVIAPGSTLSTAWIKRFKACSTAAASGWMTLRGRKKWQHVDKGFVLSDHADWKGLNSAVKETGCERVIVTHGYTDIYARWLRECGYWAEPEKNAHEGKIT